MDVILLYLIKNLFIFFLKKKLDELIYIEKIFSLFFYFFGGSTRIKAGWVDIFNPYYCGEAGRLICYL